MRPTGLGPWSGRVGPGRLACGWQSAGLSAADLAPSRAMSRPPALTHQLTHLCSILNALDILIKARRRKMPILYDPATFFISSQSHRLRNADDKHDRTAEGNVGKFVQARDSICIHKKLSTQRNFA